MTMGLDKHLALDVDKGQCPFLFFIASCLMDDRHWIVETAIKWSGYGTKVTGYDKVGISKALLPLVVEHEIKGQIEFIRGKLYVFHSLSRSHSTTYHLA